jgi:tetratricopeptide (TPR) repeat protein
MSSPSDEPSPQPPNHPKRNPAMIAGIAVLVAAGAGIFYWGLSHATRQNQSPVASPDVRTALLEALVKRTPTAENYLNLSLAYANAKRFRDQVGAAAQAIKLKPDFAEAYNNLAAGYEDLQMWDPAIAAAQQALRLKPDFQLARNNLAWAMQQKAKTR